MRPANVVNRVLSSVVKPFDSNKKPLVPDFTVAWAELIGADDP